MEKKVFVLTCENMRNGEQTNTTKIFAKKAKAKAEMLKCYNAELYDWKVTYGNDIAYSDEDENGCSIWLKGCCSQIHIVWVIEEQEVIE